MTRYLLGMERRGEPFCIHKGIIVDVRDYRESSSGTISGSQIIVDGRKINLSTIHASMVPSEVRAQLEGRGVAVPKANHPDFISVPVPGSSRQEVTIGVPMIVKIEPIMENGQVRGTNIYRHAKALSDPKPVITPLVPSAVYQKLGIPLPGVSGPSDFVFLPNATHAHHPDCYATSLILKVNPHKDFNGTLIGSTLLLDQGGLPQKSAIELTQKPLEVYRMLGLAVPRDVAQHYRPKSALANNFPLTPSP